MKIPIVIMLMFSTLFSAETIHGKYAPVCWDYERAVKYAPNPSEQQIENALGCQKFIKKDKGADNCIPCKNSGEYRCQGVVSAYCVSDEPKEQEKKKEVKPKEAEPEKLSQEEWEKAEIARVIKEEQERIEAKERIEKLLKDAEKEVADEYEKLMAAELNQNVQRIVYAQDALIQKERKDAEIAKKTVQKKKAKKQKSKKAKSKKAKKSSTSKGVLVDNNTGLMWQDNNDAKNIKKNWSNAKRYCQNLTLAGRSDWYLPSKKQFFSLKKKKSSLKNWAPAYYWTSTNFDDEIRRAWSFSFVNIEFHLKTKANYVRCVRGGK